MLLSENKDDDYYYFKTLDPDMNPNMDPDMDPNGLFPKYFFDKTFQKQSADDKKHAKLPIMQRVSYGGK